MTPNTLEEILNKGNYPDTSFCIKGKFRIKLFESQKFGTAIRRFDKKYFNQILDEQNKGEK